MDIAKIIPIPFQCLPLRGSNYDSEASHDNCLSQLQGCLGSRIQSAETLPQFRQAKANHNLLKTVLKVTL